MLLVGGDRFMQLLEGPAGVVEATYVRLARDPRHFALVTLGRRETDARLFEGWAMGSRPGRTIASAAKVPADVAALIEGIEDPTVRAYLDGFARQRAA